MREQEDQEEKSTADVHVERATLCLPDYSGDAVLQRGDHGFGEALQQYYKSPESNASERLVDMKTRLQAASTHDFWTILMRDLCDIAGAQCGFVAKRILMDDEHTAVEMPPLGEPGSCLLGVGFYLNDGHDFEKMYHDYRYHAYNSPCAHMKHDKIFVIPERMAEFVPNSPNPLPWKKSESFIAVPLFIEGKSFAHFGMIWSEEGAKARKLSWSFIEMLMHALEDMILQRLVEGRGFAKGGAVLQSTPPRIIPLDAITASQSLKPYARSLSHELRTPMQGVVGMLDIMHSTVLDAIQTQKLGHVRSVFEELRANIEMVQDSSKRAVEAADNVVHAYDLNMQMPDTSLAAEECTNTCGSLITPDSSDYLPLTKEDNDMSPSGKKRSRDEGVDYHPGPPLKKLAETTMGGLQKAFGKDALRSPISEHGDFFAQETPHPNRHSRKSSSPIPSAKHTIEANRRGSTPIPSTVLSPAHRRIVTRDFMHNLIGETMRSCHPTEIFTTRTNLGQSTHMKIKGARDEMLDLAITLSVADDVPKDIITEEQHLHFALQKVTDNAVKFTEQGEVVITVSLARNGQLLDIRVSDTGCGITDESKAHLFKPHFQEDASIIRARDGLGLSLFNAKAYVRRNLGGDMTLERSATDGPNKGSEFLIRLPISTLPDDDSEIPLVGSPILRSRQGSPCPSSPRPGLKSSASYPASGSNVPPSLLHRASSPIPPKASSMTHRTPFNRNLAKHVPLTFLVAEDNVINRNILVGYLKKLGYRNEDILLAFDGAEAVQQYQATLSRPPEKRVNAILMDLWMPNMDGYEATERILSMAAKRGESLAVMAVTADITSESMERAKQTGMKGFISKPYKVLDVQHLIMEHFGNMRIVK